MVNRLSTLFVKKATVITLSLFFMLACSEQRADHFKLAGATMGTTYHITVLKEETATVSEEELQQAIDQQLQLINQQMSTYLPDSELSKINNKPSLGEAIAVSPNLMDVLLLSHEVSWLTSGAFDITVGPLVNLWGFGPSFDVNQQQTTPDPNDIKLLIDTIGFRHIDFDLGESSITKHKAIVMDLSGVAKGYAVDKISELLDYAGFKNYMVEIGGELRLSGHSPRGIPWQIAIEQPEANSLGQVFQAVSLSGAGLATSGDYRNYFEKDGKRYSHTIDPRTGYPIDHALASVTVVAETSAYADALATAINVLGPEKGMELANSQDIAVFMIVKTEQGFTTKYSQAFEPYIINLSN